MRLSSTASLGKTVMIATRKLPRNTTKKGGKTARGESLLPHLSGDAASGFVGMKTGRLYERGYVIYVGGDLTPEMLLTDFCENNPPPDDRAVALQRIAAFVEALQACRIGNFLSVTYKPDGLPVLKVEQEYLLSEPDRRLP
jgi:hypothetical protein